MSVHNQENCLFCKIVKGEIPSERIYEDEEIYAFYDKYPAAPVHALVIPKQHIASLRQLEDERLAGKILLSIKKVARQLGLEEKGYRVVNNIGEEGGQTIYHIHFHILGGRQLTWPPG